MGEVNPFRKLSLTFAGLITPALIVAACADGPCRPLRKPDLANQVMVTPSPTPVATSQANTGATGASTLLVYKADGSLQCGSAKGISQDEMEKRDLGGIKVFSRDKRSDGLMHIQVCGSPTGMINVYEISQTQWPTAEKRGFRKLENR